MTNQLLTFPPNFLWETAACAYQIEGAVHEDGRGVTSWDTFIKESGRWFALVIQHNGLAQ